MRAILPLVPSMNDRMIRVKLLFIYHKLVPLYFAQVLLRQGMQCRGNLRIHTVPL